MFRRFGQRRLSGGVRKWWVPIACVPIACVTVGVGALSGTAAAATSSVVVAATQPVANLAPGQAAKSTVSVTNTGAATGPSTKVKIKLPTPGAGLPTVVLVAKLGTTCVAGATPQIEVCTTGSLASNASRNVAVLVGTSPSDTGPGGVTTTAKVIGPGNTLIVTWQWAPTSADLTGTVTLGPPSIELGQSITGTLSIQNIGSGTSAAFSTVVPMPGGNAPESVVSEPPGMTCIPYNFELDCYSPSMKPGSSAQVTFNFVPQSGPSVQLTANYDPFNQVIDPNRANNSATSNVVGVLGTGAVLSVTSSNVTSTPQGSNMIRTLTVSNTGDTPSYYSWVEDWSRSFPYLRTISGGPCGVFYTSSGGRVPHQVVAGTSCQLGTIAAGQSVTVSFEVEILPTLPAGVYNNNDQVFTSTPQSRITNSTATVTVFVPTTPVAPVLITPPTVPTGNTVQGDVLTANNGQWNGTPPLVFTYQWQRCDTSVANCVPIANAIGQTYSPQAADVGSTIDCVVTANNGGGSASQASPGTAVVMAAVAPTLATAPQVYALGEPMIGDTYDTTPGIWNGTPDITFSYQWYDCAGSASACTPIVGATGTSYLSQPSDAGFELETVVTATNSGGTATATSNLAPTGN